MWVLRPAVPDSPTLRFSHRLPQGMDFPTDVYSAGLAIARDGRRIAYVARDLESGDTHLYSLELNEFRASRLAATEGASSPFFSPDGRWIGFFASGKLKKVSIQGAPLVELSEAPFGGGGAWTKDNFIYFLRSMPGEIWRVPAGGGPTESVTKLEANEFVHFSPVTLPGSNAVLFAAYDRAQTTSVFLLEPASGDRSLLVESGDTPTYAPSGHLLYAHSGKLMAVAFDSRGLQPKGTAVPVLEGIQGRQWGLGDFYDLSDNGVLVHVPGLGGRPARRLIWLEPGGEPDPSSKNVERYIDPSLSPDGRRLAVAVGGDGLQQLWTLDLMRDTLTRLTFLEESAAYAPIWTPDGRRITFSASNEIFSVAVDGSEIPEALFQGGELYELVLPTSWTPDGVTLAYTKFAGFRSDVWLYDPGTNPPTQPFLATDADEGQAVFSPDGSWLAYTSNESGRHEVYVTAFPGPGGKSQISTNGGNQPRWARDGHELYYIERTSMMAVGIETRPVFTPGRPREIFDRYWPLEGAVANYDVAPDGRFLIIEPNPDEAAHQEIRIVVNWFPELKRLVPTDP